MRVPAGFWLKNFNDRVRPSVVHSFVPPELVFHIPIKRRMETATSSLVGTCSGHTAEVSSVEFTPTGELLASCSSDRTVRLWDTNTFAERIVLRGHSQGVSDVSWSPDGVLLASASDDEAVRIWDAERVSIYVSPAIQLGVPGLG